jgi:hypothetical protein
MCRPVIAVKQASTSALFDYENLLPDIHTFVPGDMAPKKLWHMAYKGLQPLTSAYWDLGRICRLTAFPTTNSA